MRYRLGIVLMSCSVGIWFFYIFATVRSDPYVEVTGDTVRATGNVVVGQHGLPEGRSVFVNDFRVSGMIATCYYVSMLLVILAWFCLYPRSGRAGAPPGNSLHGK